ncbi:MAG: phosphogluconate dehydratase [Halocynthiibacter sp.]
MPALNPMLNRITERIEMRSQKSRNDYEARMAHAATNGPARAHLSCGNQAHAYAAMPQDQSVLAEGHAPNLGIVSAYNDMLSAHQPFKTYPDLIKETARSLGASAQVAGGVPAMCDGVTQGQKGMELSLFSRDVIALAAAVALSHNTFDGALMLGVCDKIVPGLVIAAAEFGHIPIGFVPAGPMPSGITNDEKAKARLAFAEGKIDRAALLRSEMSAYHSPGTCTFYGTANSNQMLMEFMGLHLSGASFVPPDTPLREALTRNMTTRILHSAPRAAEILTVKAFVNGIVGLMATGGSTNLVLHLPAMARAAGIILTPEDFSDISALTPLLTRVYPNGAADINHFHAAGGLPLVIKTLLDHGLLHEDVQTVMGQGLQHYTQDAIMEQGSLSWRPTPPTSPNPAIIAPIDQPFQTTGGLTHLTGNIGVSLLKSSAIKADDHIISAPAAVFQSQEDVKTAFKNNLLNRDVVVVVRFQGPSANGMPELHGLTPVLSILKGRGHKIALVTDGRMSGASGKIPAAIHMEPEAIKGGAIGQIQDGDMIHLNVDTGLLSCDADLTTRPHAPAPEIPDALGSGLFQIMRNAASLPSMGASSFGADIT